MRELLGIMFYRIGEKERARAFMEDLNSVNANNLKGLVELENGNTEVAYGFFQAALKQKETSRYALEKLLPLAWKQKQYKDGEEFANRYLSRKAFQNQKEILMLKAAYIHQQKRPDEVFQIILKLNDIFNGQDPLELLQIKSLNAMAMGLHERSLNFAHKACEKNDGLLCWAELQLALRPEFLNTINREDEVHPEFEVSYEKYIEKMEIEPLNDGGLVDQRDIEELDQTLLRIQ